MLFTVLYRPGLGWNHGQSLFDHDGILDHRDFLRARFEDKTRALPFAPVELE
jgi:hypothetical protein